MAHDLPPISKIAALRRDYQQRGLGEADLDPDPFRQFARWFQEALDSKVMAEPNAMVLSTVSAEGRPRGRVMLLKGFDAEGFVFFTNYRSAKGRDLEANPQAALTFSWLEQERQVCIEGTVSRLPRAAAEAYFPTRPRGSQLGAWASDQSQVVPDRAALTARLAEAEARFPALFHRRRNGAVIAWRPSGSNSGRAAPTGCTIASVTGAMAQPGSSSGWLPESYSRDPPFPLSLAGTLGLFCGIAEAKAVDYTGHYELAAAHAESSFSLDITQTGSKADISFSAAMADGSGAAPDGDGKGEIDKAGALKFTFKDSFDNDGAGTLVLGKDGYRLKMDATRVVEPRPLRFYGDVLLKKTSDKPASS